MINITNTQVNLSFLSERMKTTENTNLVPKVSMCLSSKRYLKKKNGLSISIDRVFKRAGKALQSMQKVLKEKRKGNKPSASVALSEDEVKLLEEIEFFKNLEQRSFDKRYTI